MTLGFLVRNTLFSLAGTVLLGGCLLLPEEDQPERIKKDPLPSLECPDDCSAQVCGANRFVYCSACHAIDEGVEIVDMEYCRAPQYVSSSSLRPSSSSTIKVSSSSTIKVSSSSSLKRSSSSTNNISSSSSLKRSSSSTNNVSSSSSSKPSSSSYYWPISSSSSVIIPWPPSNPPVPPTEPPPIMTSTCGCDQTIEAVCSISTGATYINNCMASCVGDYNTFEGTCLERVVGTNNNLDVVMDALSPVVEQMTPEEVLVIHEAINSLDLPPGYETMDEVELQAALEDQVFTQLISDPELQMILLKYLGQ